MPGLVGIIGKGPADVRRQELGRMVACMHRRSQLVSGTYADDELGVYVGWTCHKDSYSDCLPIADASDGSVMFFAGEHYAPDGLEELRLAQRHGCPPVRASVLLPLYRQLGKAFFPYLNGFFHGLIIDRRDGRISLFNDKFGMQRLYYHERSDILFFASEAKSILAIHPELCAFDLKGLGEWLSCGAVLENRSLYRGIRVIPGASLWTWSRDGSLMKRQYFAPADWEDRPKKEVAEYYAELRSTFLKRLPLYLQSDAKIGMSVTGGLDTRIIMANLGIHKGRVHGYSFDGPYRENLDVSIGRRISQAMGIPHTTIKITNDFFLQFGQLATEVVLSTDGNLEMSGAPNIFVNKIAREISPIRLTGNYGSEVLRRHRAFSPSNSFCRVLHKPWADAVEYAARTWKNIQNGHPLSFVAFRQIPWYSYNRLQAEQSVLQMRSPFMDNALLETMYQAPDISTRSRDISLRLIHGGDRRLAGIMTDRGVTYPKKSQWPVTRAWYEFIFKMEYYASHGMPRLAASVDKNLGRLSLEHNFLGRNKYYHLRQWFRDELADYIEDTILDPVSLSREFLKRVEVIKAVQSHLAGTENHTHTLSKLITLELVYRNIFHNKRSLG